MSKIVCVIWDLQARIRVGAPLTFYTEAEARRWALSLLDGDNSKGNLISSNPEDFELWLVAEEDDTSPQLCLLDAKLLFRFSDFRRSPLPNNPAPEEKKS